MKRFMAWLDFEKEFIAGRKQKTAEEIDSLAISEQAKKALHQLFGHYDACSDTLRGLALGYTQEINPFDRFSRDIEEVLSNPPKYS